MQQKIVLIGPSGVGKSQIFDNFTKRENTVFVEGREPTIGAQHGSLMGADLQDTAGEQRYRALLPMYIKGTTVVLIVIDHKTLRGEDGSEVLSEFLKAVSDSAPSAAVKIVVSKMDEDSGVALDPQTDEARIDEIKAGCNEKIGSASGLPDGFNPKEDIIYYSAKIQTQKLITKELKLEDDPLVKKSVMPIVDEGVARKLQREYAEPIVSEVNWNAIWKLLEPGLIIFGKVLLFLLIATALTVVLGAIGFGIGAAAGAWSGPGAFFTAIGGAFAGAVTAWNLAVLIAAPLLGLSITGIGFGLWHRNPPPPPGSLPGGNQDLDNPLGYQSSTNPTSTGRGVVSALTANQSDQVIGGLPPVQPTTGDSKTELGTGKTPKKD